MTDGDAADRHSRTRDPGRIAACALPGESLLAHYRDIGAYADCYAIEIALPVSHAEYIEAFYTTWVFKLERWILARFVSRPSTDAQARALASGERDAFAAWHVEGRTVDQLLLCDFQSRTRSWLMTVAIPDESATATRLYFGSAVVPVTHAASGQARMGFVFRALLGFHKVYSRVLLGAATSRLRRSRGGRM